MGIWEKLLLLQASNYTHYFHFNKKWQAFEYPSSKPQDGQIIIAWIIIAVLL